MFSIPMELFFVLERIFVMTVCPTALEKVPLIAALLFFAFKRRSARTSRWLAALVRIFCILIRSPNLDTKFFKTARQLFPLEKVSFQSVRLKYFTGFLTPFNRRYLLHHNDTFYKIITRLFILHFI